MYVTGLSAGHTYTIRIGYDATKDGLHAYDHLRCYDAGRQTGQAIAQNHGRESLEVRR